MANRGLSDNPWFFERSRTFIIILALKVYDYFQFALKLDKMLLGNDIYIYMLWDDNVWSKIYSGEIVLKKTKHVRISKNDRHASEIINIAKLLTNAERVIISERQAEFDVTFHNITNPIAWWDEVKQAITNATCSGIGVTVEESKFKIFRYTI